MRRAARGRRAGERPERRRTRPQRRPRATPATTSAPARADLALVLRDPRYPVRISVAHHPFGKVWLTRAYHRALVEAISARAAHPVRGCSPSVRFCPRADSRPCGWLMLACQEAQESQSLASCRTTACRTLLLVSPSLP